MERKNGIEKEPRKKLAEVEEKVCLQQRMVGRGSGVGGGGGSGCGSCWVKKVPRSRKK